MLPCRRFIVLAVLLLQVLLPAWADEPVATRVVQLRQVPRSMPVDATVEAVSQAVVAAQVAGRLLDVRADAGKPVRKGDLLARIDARESTEALAAAQAALANAKAAYERTLSLHRQKFVSAAAVDKARADYDAANAASGAAQATRSHSSITAPISGIIARRHAEAGEMAEPGRPLFTVFEPKGLRIVARVAQFRLADLRAASRAWIEFPELGKRFESRSITLLPTADAQTHVVEVRVGLPPEAAFAMPGMAARVHFVTGESSLLTVPASAVLRRGEVNSVYVRLGDGRTVLRQLRLGEATADGEIEVLAGLKAGESIALDPVKAAIDLKAGKPAVAGR